MLAELAFGREIVHTINSESFLCGRGDSDAAKSLGFLNAGNNAEDCRRHTSMLEMGGQHRLRQTAVWVNALLYCQI